MFRSRVALCLPFLLVVLGACTQGPVKPEPLDFGSDPRILRGTWTGKSKDGRSLVLEVKAGLPGEDGYEVSGTFRLDDKVPVKFSGVVRVPVTQASPGLSAQLSPVCGETFAAFSDDDTWEFCGDAPEGSPPQFDVVLLNQIDQFAPGGASSFSVTKKADGAQDDTDLLVGGDIVYVQDEPFTHPEAFIFTEDSHAVVQLYYSVSALGDAPIELVAETMIESIVSFPLAYRIEGDPETVFAREGDYLLDVEVFSGAGDEAVVGDLINEFYTPVPSPGAEVEVRVTGLESCDSPDVGGFCL